MLIKDIRYSVCDKSLGKTKKDRDYFKITCFCNLGYIIPIFVNAETFSYLSVGDDVTEYIHIFYNDNKNVYHLNMSERS